MKIKLSMKVLKFVMKDLSEIAKEKVNVILLILFFFKREYRVTLEMH